LLTRVIERDPEHVDARVQLADMALSNRDWKTASQQLEALTKLDPKNASVWNNLGLGYKGFGRFDEARAAFQKAIALDAAFAEPALNLGILELRHLANPEAARVALESYLGKATSPAREADNLLEEARTLIASQAEEKRMLAEAAKAEEEARRKAAEEAKAAAQQQPTPPSPPAGQEPAATNDNAAVGAPAAASGDPGASAGTAVAEGAVEGPPPPTAPAGPAKAAKKPPKKPTKEKEQEKKPDAPAKEDNFYDD
jgi:tetratricopeptide (TPR) repeat protein